MADCSLNEAAMRQAQANLDAVAKPLGSLGRFEDMICRIAGITGSPEIQIRPRCILTFCGDNGVVAEGISQSDQSVTAKVARSIAEGTGNVNLMAALSGTEVFCVDMGMASEVEVPGILLKRMGSGTANIRTGPAMDRATAECAVQAGIDLVGNLKAQGYRMIGIGEMGIGNTTTSVAAASVLLGLEPDLLAGRGAGLSDQGLERKKAVIREAIQRNHPDPADAMDVLARLGGFDIAGMAGAFLGGAVHRIPMVIDGVISMTAALIASRICPGAERFCLPSHVSREPAAREICRELELHPVLDAGMGLGEGTGAAMLFPLLDAALALYSGEHTFEALQMEAYVPQ